MAKKKKNFFDKINKENYTKTTPLCPHFGECGGCRFQDIDYTSQVRLKEEYLESLFGKKISVLPNNFAYAYRNRMDFTYSPNGLALRKRGDFKTIVPLQTCKIIPEQFLLLFNQVNALIAKYAFSGYDIVEHKGFFRYLVMRFAPRTGEVMLICTTTTPKKDVEDQFVLFLSELRNLVTSVYWLISDSITDISVPEVTPKVIFGAETITEKIGDVSLEISPWSFFQANTPMSEIVFNKIKSFVHGETMDLCCGVGAIALFVADKATSVIGIEAISQAIDLAKKNKLTNKKENTFFVVDHMKNLLEYAPLNLDTLIIDPPRAGLEKKVIKKIIVTDPSQIIYMSCNPKTQKIDVNIFKEFGYEVVEWYAYDMFPQTPHLETLLLLKKVC